MSSSRPPSTEDKLLRSVERAIERSYAAKQAAAPAPLWRRLLGNAAKKSKDGSAASTSASSSRRAEEQERAKKQEREEQERAKKGADAGVARGSAPRRPSEAGSKGDGGVPPAVPDSRSGHAAIMKSALARIQGDGGDDDGDTFAEMEQAMKGLMDVSFRGRARDDPVLPAEFVSKWPHGNTSLSQRDIIADPLILTSGDSIDRFSYQWSSIEAAKHFLTVPNHLLRDIITAWCFDHAIPLPSSRSTSVASEEVPPSEEEMQLLLEKLSMHSAEQQEALHRIQLLSTSSKGVHPCLVLWQNLLPKLMGLHKEWKSTWARELEEERLTIMLNLSLHRGNWVILADQVKLPEALKKTSERAEKHGYPLTVMVKVSSLVTILSEYNTFRRKFVEIDGIEKLHELLCEKDYLVRNEASAAILALCKDDATALSYVPDASLVECLSDGMVTDKCLLLLEYTSDRKSVRDLIALSVELLMEAIIATEHGVGHLTSRGIQTALGLIYNSTKEAAGRGKLEMTVILKNFVEVLRNLERKEMPLRTVFQIEEILSIALQALADRRT